MGRDGRGVAQGGRPLVQRQNFKADARRSFVNHSKLFRRFLAEIDKRVPIRDAAIGDANVHAFAVGEMDHANHRSQRKAIVSSGELIFSGPAFGQRITRDFIPDGITFEGAPLVLVDWCPGEAGPAGEKRESQA